MSAFATVAKKNFYGKIYCKEWFSDQAFYVTITDADIRSPMCLHLFVKYLDHMLVKSEQNPTVGNVQNFELFGQNG